jgi:hypothetical protein
MTTDNADVAVVSSQLTDTSALARLRHQPVAAALGPLIEAGPASRRPIRD